MVSDGTGEAHEGRPACDHTAGARGGVSDVSKSGSFGGQGPSAARSRKLGVEPGRPGGGSGLLPMQGTAAGGNDKKGARRGKGVAAVCKRSRGASAGRRRHVTRGGKEERTVDGITWDSVSEARRYTQLKDLREWGQVKWFARAPIFDVCGVRYRPDFLVVLASGEVRVEEVKSRNARFRPDWRRLVRTLAQVKHLYGVSVHVIEM